MFKRKSSPVVVEAVQAPVVVPDAMIPQGIAWTGPYDVVVVGPSRDELTPPVEAPAPVVVVGPSRDELIAVLRVLAPVVRDGVGSRELRDILAKVEG